MRIYAFLSLSMFVFNACGGGGGDNSCSDAEMCAEGFSCDVTGVCISADPFIISNEELPRATVNVAYEFTFEASGGIAPYHDWSIETDMDWVSIETVSGVISGTPTEATFGREITVFVNDSAYDDGATTSKSFLLMITDCDQTGLEQTCYMVDNDVCKVGSQTCQDEKWTDCVATGPSEDAEHCGADCSSCDLTKADRCNGNCACGTNLPCEGDLTCCAEACVDTDASTTNCGACGADCAVVIQNAAGAQCDFGSCDYTSCLAGFLDCNDDRSDGCETEVGVNHCGSCEIDCQVQTENADGVICEPRVGAGYDCNYSDCIEPNGDCDGNRVNGCEIDLSDPLHCGLCNANCFSGGTNKACIYEDGVGFHCGCALAADCKTDPAQQCCNNQCYDQDDPVHCGNCTTDCSQSSLGPLCVDGANSTCGCFTLQNCPSENLCCNQVCTPIDDDHCGDCAIACDASYGGESCNVATWDCYCTGNPECSGYGSETCAGDGTDANCE